MVKYYPDGHKARVVGSNLKDNNSQYLVQCNYYLGLKCKTGGTLAPVYIIALGLKGMTMMLIIWLVVVVGNSDMGRAPKEESNRYKSGKQII
jgi:hypothetical protein